MHSQASKATLLEGRVGRDDLYEFSSITLFSYSMQSPISPSSILNKKSNSSINAVCFSSSIPNTWHLGLGHPNSHALKLVMQECNISFPNKNFISFCSTCCMGKAHKLHSPDSHTTYTTSLELVFSDLWGPYPLTSGLKYYMSFVGLFQVYLDLLS